MFSMNNNENPHLVPLSWNLRHPHKLGYFNLISDLFDFFLADQNNQKEAEDRNIDCEIGKDNIK